MLTNSGLRCRSSHEFPHATPLPCHPVTDIPERHLRGFLYSRNLRTDRLPWGGLSWARGTVPLPHDKALKVDWKQNNRQFQLEVDSPVPSKIILPFKAEEISRLTANDRPIEIKSEPVRIDLEAGKFVLIVERK